MRIQKAKKILADCTEPCLSFGIIFQQFVLTDQLLPRVNKCRYFLIRKFYTRAEDVKWMA